MPVVALATSGSSGKKRSFSEARMRSSVGRRLALGVEEVAVPEGVVAVEEGVVAVEEGVVAAAARVGLAVAAVAAVAAAAEEEVEGSRRRQRMPSGTSKTRQAAQITTGRSRPTERTKCSAENDDMSVEKQ